MNINNISDYLRLNADKFPDKPAFLHPVRISYKELEAEVNRYSFLLERKGIRAGIRTILLTRTTHEFFILTFALLRIGAIPVMIDPGMGVNAMLNALASLKAEAFIGMPKAHLLRIIRPSVFRTVRVRIITGLRQFPGGHDSEHKTRVNQERKYPPCLAGSDKPAAIFFTSGSTGPAKGVIYTSGMLDNQITVTKSLFNIGSDETDLCTFPLLGLFALCHGNSSVIADMDMLHPASLIPARVIRNIQDFGCTRMFGSPMILNKLSQYGSAKKTRLLSLRYIISAGAPVHKSVLESFRKLIVPEARIDTPYGATEALPVTNIDASRLLSTGSYENENEDGICIGHPVEGLEVRIIEITDSQISGWDDAVQLPEGEIGEIVARGPWVATEYFNNPEANTLAKIPDPGKHDIWHRMGDLGRIDKKGDLWFYGRKSQRVITIDGALFTIPSEAVFNHHPLVSRSALVGIPGNATGFKIPVICIELKPGNHPTKKITRELLESGAGNAETKGISHILFKKKFPVDPRHNAKIFREKLALWAEKRIR
jgi:acyl-CoA synthetase (AMP-forming)/AMP-acid ligase II